MKDRVSIDLKDGVADVRLIRADKMNALDNAMFEGIIEAGDQLRAMKGVRCVVLSGEGKAFCAGLDMASFAAMKAQGDGDVPVARDLPSAHPRHRQPAAAMRLAVAHAAGAGDRRGARRGASAAASRSCSAPTCATPRPTRASR